MNTATGTKTVPLISSGTAGPLGAVHLPRLWTKLTLGNAGMLADGYDMCGQGFDQMTLTALGLDKQRTIDYVKSAKPTYVQFEQWVVEQNGGTVSPDRIKAHNAAIFGYNHSDELAGSMRSASGHTNAATADAVTLNMLEDLDELRAQVAGR